jgi:crossover junction endodeoxyribonuclease RusA
MIVLDWPPKALHPNARTHYHEKAAAAKAYRSAGYWRAQMAEASFVAGSMAARISFYPPDNRRRDLDGMLSAIKAGIDGIADYYNFSDYAINPITLERCKPVKGGRIEVVLS